MAAKLANLGEHKAALMRGHEAYSNASFARPLNHDGSANTTPKVKREGDSWAQDRVVRFAP